MSNALDPEFAQALREIMLEISAREVEECRADQALSDLGLDSMSVAEVVVMLEAKWNVILEQEEVEQIETFGQLQELMLSKRSRT